MERHAKIHGRRLDHEERMRKRKAREEGHGASEKAQNLRGLRAKLYAQKRHKEKIQMKKQIKAMEERNVQSAGDRDPSTPLPSYLLDRSNPTQAKQLSSSIKNRRAEKSARYAVPLPEKCLRLSQLVKRGPRAGSEWVTKPTFVPPNFTRRPVKYERFIRPMGLRYKRANVTHPELNVTVQLPILSVKKNPNSQLSTQLGVLSKGTIIEVNVSELGLTTASGKIVWGKWAQIQNNPEMDGCVNSVLLV
ncbi:ribosome biogenesis protein nsa-2 [Biscogniauxia sp. FL1348]|nr:ribosome biogenesis protein nsa-2 [Biscogniauxia sp. FL1348]